MELQEVQKPLTPAQRRKKALIFKKSMHKRMRTMKRFANRIPPADTLKDRAKKAAKKFVIKKKKLLPDNLLPLYPSQLTMPQKLALEKKLAKHRAMIQKLTPKMYKVVLRQAKEKLARNKQASGEK